MFTKLTFREIIKSLGRYLSIMAIIGLGVGFFAGLRSSSDSMINAANLFLRDNNFYDFQMISTIGVTDDDLKPVKEISGIKTVEGYYQKDFMWSSEDDVQHVLKGISIPKNINKLTLTSGSMPKDESQCLLDSRVFSEDYIGKTIKIDESNSEETLNSFSRKEYKVVGLVTSPLYLNFERGASNIGDGTVNGYVYFKESTFNLPAYTGAFATIDKDYKIYSKNYKKETSHLLNEVENQFNVAIDTRYNQMTFGIPKDLKNNYIEVPSIYVLDRESNAGYVSFESDAEIVGQIAKVFPLFFFLVAALVCMTTMSRMVDEKRTEIGVLKALGYSHSKIVGKFLFYAGSSGLIGSITGFFWGIYIFPEVIWNAYKISYDFTREIDYHINYVLLIFCVIVSLFCALSSTFLSCEKDFQEMPASLIRPKVLKNGQRIFLEKIEFIWNRFSFLYKVSFRNVFRYKKRFLMMILGISGCTALVLTGFGINDSISNIATFQFEEIQNYHYEVTFKDDISNELEEWVESENSHIQKAMSLGRVRVVISKGKTIKYCDLLVVDSDQINEYLDIKNDSGKISVPKSDSMILCTKLAEGLDVNDGDILRVTDSNGNNQTIEVKSIFTNYVGNYGIISKEAYKKVFGETIPEKKVFVKLKFIDGSVNSSNKDIVYKSAAKTIKNPMVVGTFINYDSLKRVNAMMKGLDSVVFLVILSAGALALVVLYNLTNINITERVREIATIKVLGFTPTEVSLYVFRENVILTLIGSFVGLGLGKLLHTFVMTQITVDLIHFDIRITWPSYLYSIIITLGFAALVNAILFIRLQKISMTESLKAVE